MNYPPPSTNKTKPKRQFPLVRHVYFYWGFRPATRAAARHVLASGRVAVIVPGGVRECLEMDAQGRYEVAFVR